MTRRPAAFRPDDPHVIVCGRRLRARQKATVRVVPQPENFDLPVLVEAPLPAKRRFPWGKIFWSALGGLVALGTGLATTALIEELYARATWLGTFGAVLAALGGAWRSSSSVPREIVGLFRLASIREATRARRAGACRG
jgi:putative membrane protein